MLQQIYQQLDHNQHQWHATMQQQQQQQQQQHGRRRCRRPQQRAPAAAAGALVLSAVLLLACAARPCSALHEGEFLHTSKRSQYAQMRTAWRDLTEHHCPRFGRPRMVVLPLYEPAGVPGPVTDYRVQLSFDGDRTITPWVRVIGARAVPPGGVPLVRVVLSRAGGELRSARADVVALPQGMLADADAAQLAAAYNNATHWPKHVPVAYEWRADPDASLERGAYVMLVAALGAALAAAAGNLAGLRGRAAAFLRDVAGDAPGAADALLPPSVLEAIGGGGGAGGGSIGGGAPMRAPSGGLAYGGGGGSGYYGGGGGGIGFSGAQRSGSLGYEPAVAAAAASPAMATGAAVAVGGLAGSMPPGLAARTSAGGAGVGGGGGVGYGGYAAAGPAYGGGYQQYQQYGGTYQQPPPQQQYQQQQQQYQQQPQQYGYSSQGGGGWPPPRKTGAHAD